MQYIGPAMVRVELSPNPHTIFTEDYPFNIGKAYSLRDGQDATIIATGYMVTEAIKAVDLLEKDGLDVGVLNVCTWKPIDEEAIVAAAARTGAVVTAENCSDINGLGDAVACVLSENLPTPLVKVGVEDEFGHPVAVQVGDAGDLAVAAGPRHGRELHVRVVAGGLDALHLRREVLPGDQHLEPAVAVQVADAEACVGLDPGPEGAALRLAVGVVGAGLVDPHR